MFLVTNHFVTWYKFFHCKSAGQFGFTENQLKLDNVMNLQSMRSVLGQIVWDIIYHGKLCKNRYQIDHRRVEPSLASSF